MAYHTVLSRQIIAGSNPAITARADCVGLTHETTTKAENQGNGRVRPCSYASGDLTTVNEARRFSRFGVTVAPRSEEPVAYVRIVQTGPV